MKPGQSFRTALLIASALVATPALAQTAPEAATEAQPRVEARPLEDQFRVPPNSARPRVWWHWMNGNITKDGIAKDLDWMSRVGIGGLQNFDANLSTPQVVDKRLVYMDEGWKDAFNFTVDEVERHGLELAIAASPGWSETGGPWVPPADGLKKLVWSETTVPAGQRANVALAAPPSNNGPYQNAIKGGGISESMTGDKGVELPTHYGDVMVLAVPTVSAGAMPLPAASIADGAVISQVAQLMDGDLTNGISIKPGTADSVSGIIYSYSTPQTIRSASVFSPGSAAMFLGVRVAPVLEASDDGASWRKVADVPAAPVPTTASFAPVTARYFRLKLNPAPFGIAGMSPPAPGVAPPPGFERFASAGVTPVSIAEFRLSSEAQIDHGEAKAGFELVPDYYALSQGVPDDTGIDPAAVLNITRHMRPDGTLDWQAPRLPAGQQWKILRMGYSLLGTTNHPAPPEATGLEVDKFDGPAVERYLEHYIGMYREASGGRVGARGVHAILTDSIEVGAANWTPQMVAQFRRLRGYDLTPWLPALTGIIIQSRAASDQFLYDYRRTLADLMATEHYGTVARVSRKHGLRVYGEALENGRPSLGDDMAMRRYADIPMSAMWTHTREQGPNPNHVQDMRGAASVAHVYGQNLVAAESLTSAMANWDHAPSYLKRIIDLEFVNGVNRPVIHTSVHQPVDDKKPGLTLFIFGQYFNRHESWAEMAKPWVDYLSRNALMLQQGRNVADVGYFYGEEAPLSVMSASGRLNDVPVRYAYDYINADILREGLIVQNGALVTQGGARYRALYLGGKSHRMTVPVLRKLAALVEAGATVIGTAPEAGSPSFADNPTDHAALVSRLWSGAARTAVGAGQVIASRDLEGALSGLGITPQFHFTGAGEGAKIPFLQRSLRDGESFFIVNQLERTETIEARFRVTGKQPEIWRAETGKAEPVSYRIENGETIIPLTMGPDESFHVVFRKPATAMQMAVAAPSRVQIGALDGAWQVAFQPGRAGPATPVTMTRLIPLDEHSEAGIKYFSGIATYSQNFTTPRNWRAGQPMWLDLGEVREMAEVTINGQSAGIVWHAPYRLDIGALARRGRNRIEVRVANLWVNRLIGDAQPGATPITWTPTPAYLPNAPLRRSGLIGPVTLHGEAQR